MPNTTILPTSPSAPRQIAKTLSGLLAPANPGRPAGLERWRSAVGGAIERGLDLGVGQQRRGGRRPCRSGGPRWRVAIRAWLVAAVVGGSLELIDSSRQRLAASRAGYLCFAQRTQPPGRGVGGRCRASLPGRLRLAGTEARGLRRACCRWSARPVASVVRAAGVRLAGGGAPVQVAWAAGPFLRRSTGASYRLRLGAGGGRDVAECVLALEISALVRRW